AASRAAEAAGLQGKFWEMYDVLFQQQSSWSNSTSPYAIFENYATQLGLDVAKFKQDYASSVVNDTINADMKAAKALGATGTPTFVLDGKKVEQNPSSQEAFDKLIADAIAAKNKQGN